jgi:hypothetical protein
MRAARALLAALALAAALALPAAPARADDTGSAPAAGTGAPAGTSAPAGAADDDTALFLKGANATAAGEYGAAIDALEALADRGFVHPDASYDRGLAYLMRIRAHAERPGDLGRAAAAFEETLRLRPDDADADKALDAIRVEVTKRRARKGGSTTSVRPTLDRVVAGLVHHDTWTIAALVASFLLALGLVLRRFDSVDRAPPGGGEASATPASAVATKRGAPAHPIHVAGSVLVAVGLVALVALVPIAVHARTLHLTTRPGVVVVPEAHLTDETGRASGEDAIPEAAAVEVGERRAGIVHVRWGAVEGWLPATSVRVLP